MAMSFDTSLPTGLSVPDALVETGSFARRQSLGSTPAGATRISPVGTQPQSDAADGRRPPVLSGSAAVVRTAGKTARGGAAVRGYPCESACSLRSTAFLGCLSPRHFACGGLADSVVAGATNPRTTRNGNGRGGWCWLRSSVPSSAATPCGTSELFVRDEPSNLMADGFDVATRFGEPASAIYGRYGSSPALRRPA